MTKNELWKIYCEKEKEFQGAKEKRTTYTILAFAVAYFLLFGIVGKPDDLVDCAGMFLAAIVLSLIHFVVNATIFGQLFEASEGERKVLENIKKRMGETE